MAKLARKLALYVAEARFAARAPKSAAAKLALAGATVAFHSRNAFGFAPNPEPRLRVDLDIDGYEAAITLRPRDGDLAILYEIFARSAYDIPTTLLTPGSVQTVIDAGANIGFASLYFAARYPNARNIIAIEPNPENFALLVANTKSDPRIIPLNACVTAETGQRVFIETTGRGSHFQSNRKGRGVEVQGMTIGEIAAAHGLSQIDLLKIDVEGAEREIFGKASFMPMVGVVAAELHGAYDITRFNADLKPWGFAARLNEAADDPQLFLASRS